MSKAIIKFNSGNGAVLCSTCSVIIRAGLQMTKDDWSAARGEKNLPAQYCTKHTK